MFSGSRLAHTQLGVLAAAPDPQAWLADVLARIADHKVTNLAELLPWNWRHPFALNLAA
jgi:hypothetical protein